jgi:excinuclease ABC subunit B
LITASEADYFKVPTEVDDMEQYTAENIEATIAKLESDMRTAAKKFEFEKAAELRDRIKVLRDRELQLA